MIDYIILSIYFLITLHYIIVLIILFCMNILNKNLKNKLKKTIYDVENLKSRFKKKLCFEEINFIYFSSNDKMKIFPSNIPRFSFNYRCHFENNKFVIYLIHNYYQQEIYKQMYSITTLRNEIFTDENKIKRIKVFDDLHTMNEISSIKYVHLMTFTEFKNEYSSLSINKYRSEKNCNLHMYLDEILNNYCQEYDNSIKHLYIDNQIENNVECTLFLKFPFVEKFKEIFIKFLRYKYSSYRKENEMYWNKLLLNEYFSFTISFHTFLKIFEILFNFKIVNHFSKELIHLNIKDDLIDLLYEYKQIYLTYN